MNNEAVKCSRTVLLESGPGHATRCADTPFFDVFRQTRRRLLEQRENPDDVRMKLESLNLGRLRVASKGIGRADETQGERPAYVTFDKDTHGAKKVVKLANIDPKVEHKLLIEAGGYTKIEQAIPAGQLKNDYNFVLQRDEKAE